MAVDVLRSCYSKLVYWDSARTLSSTITWYFVDDDAKWFPGPNRFTSEVWDKVHWWGPGAGEDWATGRKYYNGRKPGPFTGQGPPCGPLSWFEHGCPSGAFPLPRNPDGLPACCFPFSFVGQGCRCNSGRALPPPIASETGSGCNCRSGVLREEPTEVFVFVGNGCTCRSGVESFRFVGSGCNCRSGVFVGGPYSTGFSDGYDVI